MLSDWDKAELAKTMPIYNPYGICPKCFGEEVRTAYDKGHDCTDEHCSIRVPEHHVRTCQRCHYQWIESLPSEDKESQDA